MSRGVTRHPGAGAAGPFRVGARDGMPPSFPFPTIKSSSRCRRDRHNRQGLIVIVIAPMGLRGQVDSGAETSSRRPRVTSVSARCGDEEPWEQGTRRRSRTAPQRSRREVGDRAAEVTAQDQFLVSAPGSTAAIDIRCVVHA
jgi:hypothetical protein